MSQRSFRIATVIVAASIALVLGLGWFAYAKARRYPIEAHDGSGAQIEVEIPRNQSFPQIARLLASKDIISRPTWFRLYAMWRGDTTNVKAGKYVLTDNMTPQLVLNTLVEGVKEVTVQVTLPEGKNMLEYFELIEQAKIATAAELEKLARDPTFLAKFGIAGDSIDGYLFPDTYDFRLNEKPSIVLSRLVAKNREVWNAVAKAHNRDFSKLKSDLKWTDRDALIMASIVEKEAVDPAERPRIAQVFINRLTSPTFKPKRLETDPTIRYGCLVPVKKSPSCIGWDKTGGLKRAQLDDSDNAYNTYRHEGLPPGPISNPGRGSIEAVMQPDGSDYFFFVAKDARNHAFAKTVEDHDRNVDKYIRHR
jgi:UPF0755 protein